MKPIPLKYLPKIGAAVAFLLLLILVFLLFKGRKSSGLQSELLLDLFPDFYSHVSNFAISYLLYSGLGYFWLLLGLRLRHISLFGLLLIIANFIYELFLPILNTRDLIDAYYGLAGTILAFCFLALVHRFGLQLNPLFKNPEQGQQ